MWSHTLTISLHNAFTVRDTQCVTDHTHSLNYTPLYKHTQGCTAAFLLLCFRDGTELWTQYSRRSRPCLSARLQLCKYLVWDNLIQTECFNSCYMQNTSVHKRSFEYSTLSSSVHCALICIEMMEDSASFYCKWRTYTHFNVHIQ